MSATGEPAEPRRTGDETVKGFCTLCARTAYIRNGNDFFCPVCSSPLLAEDPVADLESR